jgi:chorismate mutase / prephenate dehydratase
VIDELRAQITATDETILDSVNRRLELVARLKTYKEEHGIDFVDPAREDELLAHLAQVNTGPLSDDGLRTFFAELLALCKREL